MATQALQWTPSGLRSRLLGFQMALWARVLRISRRKPKSLRLCESLPLGERRFVAVVAFEKRRFLVGGTASSLVLLTRLGDEAGVKLSAADENSEKDWEDERGDGKC